MVLHSSGMISDIGDIRFVRFLAPSLAALLLATACQPVVSAGKASPSPAPAPKHVFVIVLENTPYRLALRQPYIAGLANQYAVATNYSEISNPSLPNYLAMTSGSTWGIADDLYHTLPAAGLGNQLSTAGISWKAYMEGFTGDCFSSPDPYAVKHNPFAYYGGVCPPNVVPMTDLTTDLNGDTPLLSWITPGMCNDGHDCGVASADRWLSQTVPQIIGSTAWKRGGALFITWDAPGAGNGPGALLVIASGLQRPFTVPLKHSFMLPT